MLVHRRADPVVALEGNICLTVERQAHVHPSKLILFRQDFDFHRVVVWEHNRLLGEAVWIDGRENDR